MAVSVLDIQVNSQGAVRGLRDVDSASQKLDSTVTGVNTKLRDASGRFIAAGSSATQASSQIEKLAGSFQTLKTIALNTLATLGVTASFNKIISDSVELEKNIRRLGTVGVDTKEINSALTQLGERLGNVVSKADLAAASYQAASAGFSDTAGNVQILEAATKAAVGGLADTQAVTEVLVKTLNAYGMSGSQAAKVTDSISKAVELGNQEWSDYTSQLGRVVSIAALAGVSINEVNAFIAAATKNGATAEIAFTGLSAGLNTLLQPTKESSDAAKSLGIEWNLSGLQAKGFTGLMAELAQKQDANKGAVVRLLGSQEAMRGVFAANAKAGADFKDILLQLGNASGKTDADFQTMAGSLDNQIKRLDTAMKIFSESAYNAFGPSFTAIISTAADSIIAYTKEIDKTKFAIDLLMATPLGKFFSDVAVQIGIAASNMQDFYLFAAKTMPIIGPVTSAIEIRNNFIKSQGFTGRGLPPSANVPSQYPEGVTGAPRRPAPPTGLSNIYDPNAGKANKASTAAIDKAAAEALRLKNSLGDLAIEGNLKNYIYKIDNKIFEANLRNDKETAIRLEGQKKLAEISAAAAKLEYDKITPLEKQRKIALLLDDQAISHNNTQQQLIMNQVAVAKQAEAAIRPTIQENELMQAKLDGTEVEYQKRLLIQQIMHDNPTLQMKDVDAVVTKNQALQQQLTQAEQLKAVYSDIGMSIKSGIVDSIKGAVDGTKSLGEVAANVLSNISSKLLDVAINMALFGAMSGTGTGGGLFGGLFKGARATGGPVTSGSTYLVGERGPELFTPSRGGSIIPNGAMGGGTSVVVNVDANGSSVQGDQGQSRQLGVVISAAVQAELVKQQRPGGLLASTRR